MLAKKIGTLCLLTHTKHFLKLIGSHSALVLSLSLAGVMTCEARDRFDTNNVIRGKWPGWSPSHVSSLGIRGPAPSGSLVKRGSMVQRSSYQASSLQDYDYLGRSTGTRAWVDNL